MSAKRKPAYGLHKASGQARVRIDGDDIYLGVYGTPESRDQYDDLMAEWFAKHGDVSGYRLTVDELAIRFIEHAEQYYRKNGQPTGEANNIRSALRPMVAMFGTVRVRDFGPLKLKDVRQSMIDDGCCRTSINRRVARIKLSFKWAVENELIPVDVYQSIATVAGLKRGRTEAKESKPVAPVSDAAVDAVRPFVTSPVWAMIQLQRLTGMRPGEVLSMRGCELNVSGEVWEYVPESHKTEHHGKSRLVFLGPRSQAILREFLTADLNAYLFSPTDGRAEFVRNNYRSDAKQKSEGKHKPRKRYSVHTYHRAIQRACERAFEMPDKLAKTEAAVWRRNHCWSPNQLRHSAATVIRRVSDIDTARTVLGHSTVSTTEIYAERDAASARRIMGKIG